MKGSTKSVDHPAISIIIPCYNGSKFIASCIESIRRQTMTGYEVVIVNDGSTDDSQMLLAREIGDDGRYRVLTVPNAGPMTARMTGVKSARAPYIFMLDIDDVLYPDALELLCDKAFESGADIVAGGFDMIRAGKKLSSRIPNFGEVGGLRYCELMMCGKAGWQMYPKLIRRELFERGNVQAPPGVSIGEDAVLSLQLAAAATSVACVNKALYGYVQHQQSMMHSRGGGYERYFEAPRIIEKIYGDLGLSGPMADYIDSLWLLSLSSASRVYGRSLDRGLVRRIYRAHGSRRAFAKIQPHKRLYLCLYIAAMLAGLGRGESRKSAGVGKGRSAA